MIKKCINFYKKYEEIINYLIAGVLSTVVGWTVKFFLAAVILDVDIPWHNMMQSFLSWTASVIFSYFINRKFVFKSIETDQVKEAFKFTTSRLSTLVLDMLVMVVMVNIMGLNFTFSVMSSAVIVIIINYILSKLFVFNKKKHVVSE